jgi:hypothetical protein
MGQKTWQIAVNGRPHTVELEHGALAGQRVIRVDGEVVERSRKTFDTGSTHHVTVDGQDYTSRILTNGATFRYELDADATNGAVDAPAASATTDATTEAETQMRAEIRSWGMWLLVWGVIQLVGASFLSATWSVVLIPIALGSFLFRTPANFVVYATMLGWAGLTNLFGGSLPLVGFGLLQLYLAFTVGRKFFFYRRALGAAASDGQGAVAQADWTTGQAATLFPALAGGFTAWSVLGCVLVLLWIAPSEGEMLAQGAGTLMEINLNLAVVGFGLGLASVLAGFRYRAVAIASAIVSGLLLGSAVLLTVIS